MVNIYMLPNERIYDKKKKAWLQCIFQALTRQYLKTVLLRCFVAYVCIDHGMAENKHFFSICFKSSLKQAPALRIHHPRSSCLLPDSWRFGGYRDFSPVVQPLRGDHGYRLAYSSPRSSYTRWGSQKCC